MKIKQAIALAAGLLVSVSLGVVAQISGGGVEGGGRIPGGSAFATQYKNGNNFGGTGPGTSGQVLTSRGASLSPTFQAAATTSPAGSTGAMQYNNAGAFGGTGPGTAGQVLTSNGAGVAPTFQAGGGVAGSNQQVQFNNSSAFGGATGLLWNSGTSTFSSTGTTIFTGVTTAGDDFHISATLIRDTPISPAALASGSTNDYNPASLVGSHSIGRITPDATLGSTLTGLQAASQAGSIVTLFNIQTGVTGVLIFTHQDAGSSAANRFILPGEVSLAIPAGGSISFWYDGTTARWRVMD